MSTTDLVKQKSGFTIVELLIAMAGFSFVLLLVTIVMISIGNLYSKGINKTKIEDANRYIVEDLSKQLKYNYSTSFSYIPDNPDTTGVYCIGNIKYSYQIGVMPTTTDYALKRSYMGPGDTCVKSNTGDELVPNNSMLTSFKIDQQPLGGKQYFIEAALLYGSKDNLVNPSELSDNPECKVDNSYQYCAVTSLKTVVTSRL